MTETTGLAAARQDMLKYIRWHANAYASPAPVLELHERLAGFGLDDAAAEHLLKLLVDEGCIRHQRNEVLAGYVPV